MKRAGCAWPGHAPGGAVRSGRRRRRGGRQPQRDQQDPAQQDRPQHDLQPGVTGGENTPVMVVDWQNDPIKDNLLHVDLKRIDLTKRIAREGAGAHRRASRRA